MNQGTILAVDDTLASLKLLTDILAAEGYQVHPADSGEHALASVAANAPELILLDIRMPGMDGFEVLRRLKAQEQSRDIPVILLSAFGEVEHRIEGFKLGAVDFIAKPFQRDELLARTHTHLELFRLRKRLEHQTAELRQTYEQLQLATSAEHELDEAALAESEARLRATIENSMDAVVQINSEGIITGWSKQSEGIFGWTRAEAIGQAMHETIIPPLHREAHVQGMKHFLLTGEGPILNKRVEIVGLHRDGHEFPIELAVAPIKMGGQCEFSAFIRDITKRKGFEEKLRRSNIELEQFNAAISSDLLFAKDIVNHIMRSGGLLDPEIRFFMRPTQQFSGDFIAAARDNNSDLRVMLADVTGHGLQAALFLLPIFRIFYTMVKKGLPTCVIVAEINQTMREIAVAGHFIAAVVAHISRDGSFYEVWNGGIPTAVHVQKNGELHEFHSRHLPFGVVDANAFEAATEIFHAQAGALLLSSDGLTDAENAAGEPFGEMRLKNLLQTSTPEKLFDSILSELEIHIGGGSAHDDISMMLARCGA